jgi:UDP-glucose 4-epimerase
MLGSHFADWVIENCPEYEVVGIDNLEGGYIENVHPKVSFYQMNVGDDLTHIFETRNVEVFYAFGCYSAEGISPFMRRFNYTNNLVSTANAVNFCIKYKVKLVYASSMSVYGHGNPPFRENHQCFPIDPYGIAKYAGELDI